MTTKIELRGDAGDSQLPVCDQLMPELAAKGQQWLIELARWYESNWKLASRGVPPPSADRVLSLIAADRQGEARSVLQSIDGRYASVDQGTMAERVDVDLQVSDDRKACDDQNAGDNRQTSPESDVCDAADTATQSLDTRALQAAMGGPQLNGEETDRDRGHDVTLDSNVSPSVAATQTLDGASPDNTGDPDRTQATPNIRLGKAGRVVKQGVTDRPDIPGYQIKGVLGRGGMGIVYLAHQEGIDRPVALKMILSRGEIDHTALDRFYAEARAIGRFQHENIVRIYDAGTHQGMPYFSLEYVDGSSLAQQLGGEPMDPREAAKLMEPMSRAMQVAHDEGVIHRDLKPANVLMTRDGAPKITDFGLAKELEQDQQLSQDGTVVGTPAFMSPEQASGARDVGPLTDVYGLGALFYCLLTGRPPFQGAKATDTLMQVLHDDPVEPIKLQPAIPKDLETICLKCLQKDPAQRYPDAAALSADLGRFLRGEPIEARPVGRAERIWRWCKRNPTVAVASGVAAALALVLMIGGPVTAAIIYQQNQQVSAAKDDAEFNADLADQRAEEATEARQLAEQNAVKASQNAEAASVQERNAIDVLKRVTNAIQEAMLGNSNLAPTRKKIIDVVKNGMNQLDDRANIAREKNFITAGIHVRMGDINMDIGEVGRALSEYKKCEAVFATLDQEGALPNPRRNWSKIYMQIGEASRMLGEFTEAEEYYQKSLRLRRERAESSPSLSSLSDLALSLGKVGSLAQILGKLDVARESMEEAVAIRQRLFKSQRNADRFNEVLSVKLLLAKIVFQQGQTSEGLSMIGDAADQMRNHAATNPQSERAKHNSAMFDSEAAVMLLYTGQTALAEEKFERASGVFEELLRVNPSSSQIQEELEDALYGWLVARREAGKQENETIEERLLALREKAVKQDPENVAKQLRQLVALARCGRLVEGKQLADSIEPKLAPEDPQQYLLACAYALLSEAREGEHGLADDVLADLPEAAEFRESAMVALRRSCEPGFYRPTDLKLDPDLDPLRGSESFKALLDVTTASSGDAPSA